MATKDTNNKQYYCQKCGKTLRGTEFYTSNNLEKYPNDGKLNYCKKCMTMHVNYKDPETFLWILQEADVPYIPEVWNATVLRLSEGGKTPSNTTVVGRYLSRMRISQYKKYRWADNQALREKAAAEIRAAMEAQHFSESEIQEKLETGFVALPEGDVEVPNLNELPDTPGPSTLSANDIVFDSGDDYFGRQNNAQELEEDLDLTEEDKKYLLLKWGKTYKPSEWVQLEQFYEDMMKSYDIQGAGHEDTLKLLCKTSLKCNQLIDIGDVEGYQKMAKVYDQLMKSGKFSAAQNKENEGEYVDSVGELVRLCEEQGYIERYYVEQPQDKVDLTLRDMQTYTKNLIIEETNLSNLVELAIQRNAKEDEEAQEHNDDELVFEEDLSLEAVENMALQGQQGVDDEDFENFSEFLENEASKDKNAGTEE